MNYESEYLDLLEYAIAHGEPRHSRAGLTRALFGVKLSLNLDTFPLLQTRRIFWHPVFAELAAFLEGTTDVRRFEDLGCPYWRANAEAWKPGANSVGRVYGVQWRNWQGPNGKVDQLVELVDGLREDPHGRRHILTAWNPGELDEMCLPPCHIMAQFYTHDEHLDCLVYMRSVDICLGLPSDVILYAMLQTLIAQNLGLIPRKLMFCLGDAHVYENHLDMARIQILRTIGAVEPHIFNPISNSLFHFKPDLVEVINYHPRSPIKYILNV